MALADTEPRSGRFHHPLLNRLDEQQREMPSSLEQRPRKGRLRWQRPPGSSFSQLARKR